MKLIFDRIPNGKMYCTLSHTVLLFFLTPKLLSGDWSQILRDGSNELLNTHKLQIYNVIMDTLEVVVRFMRNVKKRYIPVHSIVNFWYRTLQSVFSSITIHIRVALNSQYFVVFCQANSSKSKRQMRRLLLCFPDIPYILPVVFTSQAVRALSKNANLIKFIARRLYGCLEKCFKCISTVTIFGIAHSG